MIRVSHVVAYTVGYSLLCDRGQHGGVLKPTKNYHFFSIFTRLCHFSQGFGEVKEWDILELHEMIKVSNLVACSMVLNLLCDLSRQAGLLKLTKTLNCNYF